MKIAKFPKTFFSKTSIDPVESMKSLIKAKGIYCTCLNSDESISDFNNTIFNNTAIYTSEIAISPTRIIFCLYSLVINTLSFFRNIQLCSKYQFVRFIKNKSLLIIFSHITCIFIRSNFCYFIFLNHLTQNKFYCFNTDIRHFFSDILL